MTNDEIRRNDEIRMTKPAAAQLRVFRHSSFGFLSSFVIQRFVQVRFLVPMHARKWKEAFRESTHPRPTPDPSQEGSERSSAPSQFPSWERSRRSSVA